MKSPITSGVAVKIGPPIFICTTPVTLFAIWQGLFTNCPAEPSGKELLLRKKREA